MTTPEEKPPTPPIEDQSKLECPGDNSGRRFKHYWRWWWEDPGRKAGEWPRKSICSTCGEIVTPKRFNGQ